MGTDEAGSPACGRSPCKDDNEVWPIFAATRRDGASFPGFVVARRSKMPDIRFSLLKKSAVILR